MTRGKLETLAICRTLALARAAIAAAVAEELADRFHDPAAARAW